MSEAGLSMHVTKGLFVWPCHTPAICIFTLPVHTERICGNRRPGLGRQPDLFCIHAEVKYAEDQNIGPRWEVCG